MNLPLVLAACVAALSCSAAQADSPLDADALRAVDKPSIIGWSLMDSAQPPTCMADRSLNHALPVSGREGTYGARLHIGGGPIGSNLNGINLRRRDEDVCTLMQAISAEAYRGQRVRLSASLGTQDIRDGGRAGLWMRIDGADGRAVGFDNMESRPITRTQDWKRYEIVLDVPADAADIAFGFLITGRYGSVSAANFAIETVGSSVPVTAGAPPHPAASALPKEAVNLDFSRGRSHP